MANDAASGSIDNDMREAALVLQGYTVSARGRCIARIGGEYVMRYAAGYCVRIPIAGVDALALGAKWAEFNRPANAKPTMPATGDAKWSRAVSPKDGALSLQRYVASTRGGCLVQVVGNYVTRDGLRHRVRLLVDTVDPATLEAAWGAFAKAAGWINAASMEGVETAEHRVRYLGDPAERLRATG